MLTPYNYCQIIFVFSVPILMLVLGFIYIFKKDRAWAITAHMLRTVKPQRTPEWERYSTINGLILLVAGLAIMLFLLSVLNW